MVPCEHVTFPPNLVLICFTVSKTTHGRPTDGRRKSAPWQKLCCALAQSRAKSMILFAYKTEELVWCFFYFFLFFIFFFFGGGDVRWSVPGTEWATNTIDQSSTPDLYCGGSSYYTMKQSSRLDHNCYGSSWKTGPPLLWITLADRINIIMDHRSRRNH